MALGPAVSARAALAQVAQASAARAPEEPGSARAALARALEEPASAQAALELASDPALADLATARALAAASAPVWAAPVMVAARPSATR